MTQTLLVVEDVTAPAACDTLSSFISQVQALSGEQIPAPAGDGLLIDARRIMAVLGCS